VVKACSSDRLAEFRPLARPDDDFEALAPSGVGELFIECDDLE
jgi:hypothetical protein